MTDRAPIGPLTVTVLGSHWNPGPAWDGFCWERAVLREDWEDYRLDVPWRHADDSRVPWDDCGVYRLRLKRGWKRFVQVDGAWMVEMGDGERMMNRDEQIEALARRMAWAVAGPVALSRSEAIAFATIAIELAEATREAAANKCDALREWADGFHADGGTETSLAWARAAESLDGQIRAMPLPIADERGGSATDE